MRHQINPLRGRAVLAGVCLCAAAGVQARLAAPEDIRVARPNPAAHAAAPGAPWWSGFGESTLATLAQAAEARERDAEAGEDLIAARAHTLQVDSRIAAAYVAVRVLNVRLMLADEMRDSMVRQRQLVTAGAPTADRAQALTVIDARTASATRIGSALRVRRDEVIALLSDSCGTTPESIFRTLQPALAAHGVPSFDAETPRRLPRAVLAMRADVGAVQERVALSRKLAQRDDPRLSQALSGWIEAPASRADAQASPSAATAALPDAEELTRVAAEAEREVRMGLSELQRRSQEAARLAEVVRTRQMELTAVERRLDVGAASEFEVIAAFQTLLAENDLLAIAGGELAQAWIRLHASTGGRSLAAGIADE